MQWPSGSHGARCTSNSIRQPVFTSLLIAQPKIFWGQGQGLAIPCSLAAASRATGRGWPDKCPDQPKRVVRSGSTSHSLVPFPNDVPSSRRMAQTSSTRSSSPASPPTTCLHGFFLSFDYAHRLENLMSHVRPTKYLRQHATYTTATAGETPEAWGPPLQVAIPISPCVQNGRPSVWPPNSAPLGCDRSVDERHIGKYPHLPFLALPRPRRASHAAAKCVSVCVCLT